MPQVNQRKKIKSKPGRSGTVKPTLLLKKSRHAAKKKIQIRTKEAYDTVMQEIDTLMKRGEAGLSQAERSRLKLLAAAAELYEDTYDPLPLPETLPDIIRMRMYQLQLNQAFTAKLLGVSDAKFSLILGGRQRPDIAFIKAVHEKLKVDANLLLQVL